jgi:hypothetical protein
MAYRAFNWRHQNPEKRSLQRRIYKVRRQLRERNILPPTGVEMNDEEKEIYDQVGRGDFSFWDTVKTRGGIGTKLHDGGVRVNSKPKEIRTPEYMLWDRLRQSATRSGKEFTIEVEDIVIPEYCPYLCIKLTTDYKDHKLPNYFSGDRIDSSKGYIKWNVQVISLKANVMKSSATIEELLTFSRNIINLYGR